MTTLRGINFGPCWQAAGVQGWGGEGYWFHHLFLARFLYDFRGSTRVAKTTTMWNNPGHMPLKRSYDNFAPVEKWPDCIWWNWLDGRTLNAVGLAGPGAGMIANQLFCPPRLEPFMVSFMAVRKTLEERLAEFSEFVKLMNAHIRGTTYMTQIGLQINISCPNTGLDTTHLIEEARKMLDISAELPVPKIIKINVLPPVETVAEIAEHPECDAVCFTNALPFGSCERDIPWKKLFPDGSPLARRNTKFGGGGYSGPELLPLVAEYSKQLRLAKVVKPFNVGGGIRSARDVEYLFRHGWLKPGRDSIFFASAAMVRPWNIQPIIRKAHELLG